METSQDLIPLEVSRHARKSFAYVLLKPDVVLRGIIDHVVETLGQEGFDVVNFRIGYLPEEIFSQIYASGFRSDLDHWAYNLEAFRYGPVVGLLLWKRPSVAEDSCAQESLSRLKGSALPERLTAPSLRFRLGATGRVFNILHAQDSYEAALADAATWFGTDCVAALLRAGAKRKPSRESKLRIEEEVSRHGYSAGSQLNGETIFFLLVVRLAHAIEKQAMLFGASLRTMRTMGKLCWQGAAKLLESGRGFQERRGILERTLTRRDSLLLRFKKHLADNALRKDKALLEQTVYFLLDLGVQAPEGGWRLEFFWHLLSKWRVFVSDLEKYLVLGVFIYPSLMPSSIQGGKNEIDFTDEGAREEDG